MAKDSVRIDLSDIKTKVKNKKEANAMNKKQFIETSKTIAITVLVTAIITFIGGFTVGRGFEKEQTIELKTQVESIQAAATASK